MDRTSYINELKNTKTGSAWDFIVIGGGATGLGIAVDAATRGYKTVLLEQADFSKATSSRSTKLVHGGVRYLQQGDVALVREALRERGYLRRNAPHLVKNQRFVIGNYLWWEKPFYTIGLTVYDLLAGRRALGRSLPMSKKSVIKHIPQIEQQGLKGGVSYQDGQFDDSRLAINLVQTAVEHGAAVVNYAGVTNLTKEGGKVTGVVVEDKLGGGTFQLKGKCVINATGIFVDDIIKMDNPVQKPMVRPSQGVHVVVDGSFLDSDDAIMVPKTSDGRVMFGVPWHNRVILGTTDTPVKEFVMEPKPLDEEVDFILETAGRYLVKKPQRKDVLCVFAGLRPLAAPTKHSEETKTKEISRSHKLFASESGLVTITGGKWTTYRIMAEETVNLAEKTNGMKHKPCKTKHLKVHGYQANPDRSNHLYIYGSDQEHILQLQKNNPEYAQKLHPDLEFTAAEVVWAVREEMALTVDDVLARRVRALYMDAKASIEMAPLVASIMAKELNKDKSWEEEQVREYRSIAQNYFLT
ncbi:glycerol-3-phosphate dehydrogenase/oxidase [Proteiniphilum sp. X52]|uniref:glycerol-3-phosphate dehydrogenase/oxidase n=1 Tax=Proteiniphilum sp. X52 TaxID=2382159 RepID=UPI000F0A2D69|nr:glycerol-3-phosphate dehydrogenase/oxidase [Proteiniphilum sp. X52]RNC66143.1 glycerol-3-phosphate dehydrogenase/oxidase [Proteiniphilum sp. X52]